MIIEVAIVYRRRYFDPVLAQVDVAPEDVFRKFEREDFPKFRPRDRPPRDKPRPDRDRR